MRTTILTVLLVCAIVASLQPPFVRAATTVQKQTARLEPFHGPDVSNVTRYGNCQWLYPLDEPNEPLASQPAYGSDKRVYYAAHYGDAPDNTFTLVIDESGGTGTGFDTLYADLDNDNRLDPKTEKFPLTLSGLTIREARNLRVTLSVETGGKTLPYSFDFAAFRYKGARDPIEKVHATCRNSSIMVGEATFGGKRRKIALADLDSNGSFNDYEKGLFRGDRFFVDLDDDGSFANRSGARESFPYARYTQIAGSWHTIEASPDGGTVHIRLAQPSFGTVAAPKHIKRVGLSSPKQFQTLDLTQAGVKALTGTYQLDYIALEINDSSGDKWSTQGRYRSSGPAITIEPEQQATLADPLPLTTRVDVSTTPEPNTIELEVRIVDAHGGAFSTLRKNNSRHEPPARLVIRDSDGKEVTGAALEYG